MDRKKRDQNSKKRQSEAHQDPEGEQCGVRSRNLEAETGLKSLPMSNTSAISAGNPKKGFCLQDIQYNPLVSP